MWEPTWYNGKHDVVSGWSCCTSGITDVAACILTSYVVYTDNKQSFCYCAALENQNNYTVKPHYLKLNGIKNK
jgi:hypothetical protein